MFTNRPLRLGRYALAAAAAAAGFSVSAQTAPALQPGSMNPLQQLKELNQQVDEQRALNEAEALKKKKLEGVSEKKAAAEKPAGKLEFELKKIVTQPSRVLTDAELRKVFSKWEGRKITVSQIGDILDEVNKLYREKGYAVCQAAVKPQRIRGGQLEITLIEGFTDSVKVKGLKHTKESFVKGALKLPEGEVANYRDMVADLVRFNMTNDVTLAVDIHAGEKPGSSSYEISAREPDWGSVTAFTDSLGAHTTGRWRGGLSLYNSSLLGWRDQLSLLGLVSEGSQSALVGYSVPLTRFGTRLSANISYGHVKVVNGANDDLDISGNSFLSTFKLEHPFFVNENQKWTGWAQYGVQRSNTDMFGNIKIADTRIRETSLGVDGLGFVGSWLMYGTAALNHHRTNERTFEQKSHYEFFTLNGAVKKSFENRSFLLGSLRMQKKLGGDDLLTTDYFYLGQTNGVRGYYNDQISGEGGFSVSLEGSYPIYTPRLAAIAFADYGNIWGTTPYGTRHLTSVGTGLTWQPYDWAQVRTTLSVPLNRHPAGSDTPNKARFDFSISATY